MTVPYYLAINKSCKSGSEESICEKITSHYARHGIEILVTELASDDSLRKTAQKLVDTAIKNHGRLIIAGGDGTISLFATLCCRQDLQVGIIPLGTFNYFAKELSIPQELEEAVTTTITGSPKKVSLGKVNQKYFINNCSLGVYTKIIENRENDKATFGRYKLVAFLSALRTILSWRRVFSITIAIDGKPIEHAATTVFIGNNTAQYKDVGLSLAKHTERDQLGIAILKKMSLLQTALFVIKSTLKLLDYDKSLIQLHAEKCSVKHRRKKSALAIDGELCTLENPLQFSVEKDGITVLCNNT